MNLGTMITAARLRLQDSRERIWTDAELTLFANDALEELVHSEANLKRYLFPLVDGQRTYTLPKDLLEIRGVKLNNTKLFGTHAHLLEELDQQYLNATNQSWLYYLEDLRTIAFYPVPTWTDDYTAFEAAAVMISGEDGAVCQFTVDGTDATFSAEDGVVYEIIDSTQAEKFVFDTLLGETVALNDAPLTCQVTYAYKLPDLSTSADVPDLPVYMHDSIVFFMCAGALAKEGQAQDKQASAFWNARFVELQKEWRSRNLEWSRGEDQFASQRPVSWGDDLETRLRVWP